MPAPIPVVINESTADRNGMIIRTGVKRKFLTMGLLLNGPHRQWSSCFV
jgi:hypothetical protein